MNDLRAEGLIKVRPLKHTPDIFYINKYLKLIEKELFE
jgi:hypothetical protein